MKNSDVIKNFILGKQGKTNNLWTDGRVLINYYTPIAKRVDGNILVNYTNYSRSTRIIQVNLLEELRSLGKPYSLTGADFYEDKDDMMRDHLRRRS